MDILHGNMVVGQSGGPTAAINATLAGVLLGAYEAKQNGICDKIYGMKNGIEGLLREDLIDLSPVAGDKNAIKKLSLTPAAALGSCRKKLPAPDSGDALYDEVLRVFRKFNIRYFFYIGGNDSMDTVAKLSVYMKRAQYDCRVVGVPKTIDNDLCGTDHTPGFGSAAKYIAVTMSEIIRDCAVYTVPAVTVVEIMGRDAGWLTAAAALAGENGADGPDLIYLPERNFDDDRFLSDVRAALARHPNVVIAVSEGIRYADGTYVGAGRQNGARDVFGHTYLAGTGKALESFLKEKVGCKVRSIELNLPQRCASHLASATDIRESQAVGKAAVRAAVRGRSAVMLSIQRAAGEKYHVRYRAESIRKIANLVREVPDAYINENANGITEAGLAYLRPLILGEVRPEYKNGIPVHLLLS